MAALPPRLDPGRPLLAAGEGAPRSRAFDDIYFSVEDGLAESETVFLQGCGLPEAWAGRKRFVVAELGFGTGLNILALMKLWRRARPPGASLHVVSIEGFPLSPDQARRAHDVFPDIKDVSPSLLAAWPPRIKGVHRRCLPDGVFLTLAYLDVAEALAALDFAADAWFLDGFAPAKNPDMWSPKVLTAIAAHSAPGARLATFTVAGLVRRGLEAAGFAVEKKPGFGKKRENLQAIYRGPTAKSPVSPLYPRAAAPAGPVLVLGAGIAGASVTQALRRRGGEVLVLDAGSVPGSGASGMPAGLVAPRLDLDDAPAARFHRTAYAEALATYAGSTAFNPLGVMHTSKDAGEAERQRRLLDAQALPPEMVQAANVSELKVGAEGAALLLLQAGLLDPRAWIETTLAGASVQWGATVSTVERIGGTWVARDESGRAVAEAAACVAALGAGLPRLSQLSALPIQPSRGQITLAPLAGGPLAHALLWGSYATSLPDGRLLFGATHDDIDAEDAARLAPDSESDARNLAALAGFAPNLAVRIDQSRLQGQVGVRATTPDRLPYVGAVPDADAYRQRFASLAAGRVEDGPPGPVHEGLYVLGGLGGRGLTLAPSLGEALASEMLGEPGALEIGAAAALHPARMLARAIKRRE